MTDETAPKKKRTRNRGGEYERRKQLRDEMLAKRALEESKAISDAEQIKIQLVTLATRTVGAPTDADRDIDFAYKNSANPTLTPLMAPSLGAWNWYEYARVWPDKFLEICAKREDAKTKQAGTITSQRMEDDKRQQFAVIDRIEKQLTLDVVGIVNELMEKFPLDVLRTCRKHDAVWKSFSEQNP
jgi:hypothetical protein